MFSYATLGSNDLDKAVAFYLELLKEQGAKTLIKMDRIIFIGESMQSPMLALCIPYNKEAATPGNGTMLSIAPGSKEKVDELYHKAIALGASCEGAPGQRLPNKFYGAYVRDLDGNKLCFNHFG
ncbi:VOC family protein [Rheinheimera sp.]|jgi:predicted lactoylglutathione lyase|uniref:VOC family protein n=1 Tax=Rheinheimera sp. TaxID=1869214 RepID=UPI00260F79E5|nr:VOC family protein [Rheinheimera sp.]MCA1928679.1 VOC family protein [Rheinheimera sp.]